MCWTCVAVGLAIVGMSMVSRAMAGDGTPPCLQCVAVRLEHPIVVRGPSPHEPDAPVSAIKLPDSRFRDFIAGGTTFAVDGTTPVSLNGLSQSVLGPGPPGSQSECGRWITTVMQGLGILYGLVHNESRCDDPKGSYKWMSIAQSRDYGLAWKILGPIITSDEGNIPRPEGEGDCTGIDGHDGYWYAYCLRRRDIKTVVARAPIENPGSGKWMKWSGDGWNAPGLGGTGTALNGDVGMSSAYWRDADVTLLMASTNSSIRVSISEDRVHFGAVPEPLVLYDEYNWNRPTSSELYAYPSMVADQGFNNIASHFYLTYMYVPPNEDFSQRYLVAQEGWIDASAQPRYPQVRTALARWVRPDGRTWTTTGPTITAGDSYAYDVDLGYVMTASPQQNSGTRLDECFSETSGVGFLAKAGDCAAEGSVRRRPAGYVFSSEQPGTVALYSCVSPNGETFVSKRSDCEDKGTRRRLLGYALQ